MARQVRLPLRAVLLAGPVLACPTIAQAQSTTAPSSDPAVAPAREFAQSEGVQCGCLGAGVDLRLDPGNS